MTAGMGLLTYTVINSVVGMINSELSRRAAAVQQAEQRKFQQELETTRQEFQREQFEQQRQLQKELAERNRQTQLELAAEQRKTALQSVEVHKLFENWPLRIVPSQILEASQDGGLIPLKIIPVPPIVDFDKFGSAAKGFPNIESGLNEGLRQFFGKHYAFHGLERPIELVDGAWDSNRYHGGSSIKALFHMLKSEPILILESEIDGDYLNLRVGYWEPGQPKYSYESVISKLPYREIVYESAKDRALKWKATRAQLVEKLGKTEEAIDTQYGGENAHNLKLLEEEEQLRQLGIDLSTLPIHSRYKVSREDFEALCRALVACQCVIAGWVTDVHYLLTQDVPPLLPKLLPDLIQDGRDPKLLEAVVSGYEKVYDLLAKERPAWIPELSLELADSLKYLSDKTWARRQVDRSIQSWLQLRGAAPEVGTEAIEAVKSAVTVDDREYIEKLGQCLVDLGDEQSAAQTQDFLNSPPFKADFYHKRGVSHFNLGDYQTAIADYDQALKLDPNSALAYYNRGVAYSNLHDYKTAIADYNQAIHLNPQNADFYWLRGKARVEQKDYLRAIADYNQALQLNPNHSDILEDQDAVYRQKLENAYLDFTFGDHSSPVWAVAVSPDGQYIVSSSSDSTFSDYPIKIWWLSTGKELRTLRGNTACSDTVAVSPDGQYIVSGSRNSTIKIWQSSTGKELRTLYRHSRTVYAVAISPDGQYIVSGNEDNSIGIWQLSTGRELRTLSRHSSPVYAIAISPDGQYIVSGSCDKTIKVWQLSTGKELRTLSGHSDMVAAIAISPDGQYIVSSSWDKTIKVWQLSTGKELRTLSGHSSAVLAVAISPDDGQYIVSGSQDGTIKIWQLSTGKELRTLSGHSNSVHAIAISPDGQSIVSGSGDNTIKIWRLP